MTLRRPGTKRPKIVPTMRGTIKVHGIRRRPFSDLYYIFLDKGWAPFTFFVVIAFLSVNALFALLYMAQPGCIEHIEDGSFLDNFFFSVQTIATVGYGYMYPKTAYANAIATLESIVGIMGVAMVTGVVFAKFSRPKARVIFSKNAVVTMHEGKKTLMFRVANERANYIADASINATFAIPGMTSEGKNFTRMIDLPLARHRSPMFFLTWTVLHVIDEQSPLHHARVEDIKSSGAFLVCSLTGYDSTMGQTIHARHTYDVSHIVWEARFKDILTPASNEEGVVIDYQHFHTIES